MSRNFLNILTVILFVSFPAFKAIAQEQRIVIVIPGILGSVLSDDSGDLVWGNASSLNSRNFKRLNLLPSDEPPVTLSPTDVLREVPLVFGAFSIGIYSDLIRFLTGKRSFGDDRTVVGNYDEGKTLFVFPYDWRRSNFANAAQLNQFVRDTVPQNERFDIVAHSMGGIITHIFLSDFRPSDTCTDETQETGLSAEDRSLLCNAVYGDISGGTWPSVNLAGRFSEAARLNTLIEIAVPHRGSVNVASTLVGGWGRLSQILAGGKRDIQNVVLSMASVYELVPTYERCCARGFDGGEFNVLAPVLDEAFWAELVLGFGRSPCPYERCRLKREVLRIGLANRGLIDKVMDAGLPNTVVANHVMVGRLVMGTRETIYVSIESDGDGEGLSYRESSRGDGTVWEGSAKKIAAGNDAYALRSKHPFIVGSDEVQRYIFNVLIDPIQGLPSPVNSEAISLGGVKVEALALSTDPQIARRGEIVNLKLDLTSNSHSDQTNPFEEQETKATRVTFSITPYDGDTEETKIEVDLNDGKSWLKGGRAVFSAQVTLPDEPGVYKVRALIHGATIAEELLYVMEQ